MHKYDWDIGSGLYQTRIGRPDTGGVVQDTTYVYNRAGQLTKTTDPLGNVSEQASDDLLRIVSVKLPGGDSSSYTYSYYPNSNQIQSWANENGETSRRGADLNTGDTRYTIDPLNEQRRAGGTQDYQATVLTRDPATGNVTNAAVNMYAAGSNLEQSTMPAAKSSARSMSYTYTCGGMIASMTDPKGNVTNLGYDCNTGYLTSIDAPAGNGETSRRVTTITRNPDGTTQKVVDPKGQTTTYEYDGLGRLRKINYGVGTASAFSSSYTLDLNGNMTAMSDKNGSSSWVYNENNQWTSESRTQNGATKTAAYRYFANGLMSGMTTLSGDTVTFGYDKALRLTSQTDPKDAGRAISYTYDSRGRRTAITFGSGVQQTLTYDKAGRVDLLTLQRSDGTKLQSFDYSYGYDATGARTASYQNGNVASVMELDGSAVTYGYDALNRLTSAVRTGTAAFNQSYGYDADNNRTSVTVDGTTTAATYDAANQLLTYGSTTYAYDRNGNQTAIGADRLTYDAANKWTDGTVNGQGVAFSYDGFGRRVSKTVAGARTEHWYDQTGLTLETGASAATYLRDQGGTLLSTNTGGATYNYGRDRLGSVTALVSGAGALANSYTYTPWGYTQASTGTVANPFQFTSTYRDSSAYYLMGARYYHQPTGRFTQLDPLPKNMLDINRYAYVNCNPANATDPTGLDPCHSAATAAFAGYGAVVISVGPVWSASVAWIAAGMTVGAFLPIIGAGIVYGVTLLAFGALQEQASDACGLGWFPN